MKNSTSKLLTVLSILLGVLAIAASVMSILLYFDKKREEEELERYLEDSIQ